MREKPVDNAKAAGVAGITPACAGKTKVSDFDDATYRDHPRVCGKNWESDPNNRRGTGSPPRVREKPSCHISTIPLNGDHPRVCGKNSMADGTVTIKAGSPPRVREKQLMPQFEKLNQRITPACAGKTLRP